ncbi:MAG: glycosyltransferase family 4 protein [Lachnospiraceae bacterium]|nr:glycosyltransferase family 4 protein [Lachnospiraceae bacterium]
MEKIVFVVPNMVGGGTERIVALFANELVKRGYPVAIMIFAGDQVVYPLDERIEVLFVGEKSNGNPLVRLKRIKNMRNYYKANKGCYIFGFSVMGTVFSVVAAAGIPHRLLVSERSDPSKYNLWRIRNWAYGKAEKVILQTEDTKQFFPDKLRKKAVVIPNPVPGNMPLPYQGERKKRIVSVGRLEKVKNHKLLIDAFAEFCKQHTGYELHLLGVGELEQELRAQVTALGLEKEVVFRGFCENVLEEIKDCGMYVLSSDYEGISNSMIEALAMGVPVIATDCPVGGTKMYIEDGVNGLLVPVGNQAAMVQAMQKIAGDPALAGKLSANGVKIREAYGLSKIVDILIKEAGI